MDRQLAPSRPGPTRSTREEEVVYAPGWTISGLATLGTIIAVWGFKVVSPLKSGR